MTLFDFLKSKKPSINTETTQTQIYKTEKKLACVHCGKTDDNTLAFPGHQIYDISVGHSYAQRSDCFAKLRTGLKMLDTDDMLRQIRSYPEERRRNAITD